MSGIFLYKGFSVTVDLLIYGTLSPPAALPSPPLSFALALGGLDSDLYVALSYR